MQGVETSAAAIPSVGALLGSVGVALAGALPGVIAGMVVVAGVTLLGRLRKGR